MKKALLALSLLSASAMTLNAAVDPIVIDFALAQTNRTNTVSDITLSSTTEGVTATLDEISHPLFSGPYSYAFSENNVACIGTNQNALDGGSLYWIFTVSGLTGIDELENIVVRFDFINSQGLCQYETGRTNRRMIASLTSGETTVTLPEQDLCNGATCTGGVNGITRRPVAFAPADGAYSVNPDGTVTFKVNLQQGNPAVGCFFGISQLTLNPKQVEEKDVAIADYRDGVVAGLNNMGLFGSDLIAGVEGIDPQDYDTAESGKAAVDAAAGQAYATLSCKTFTFRNFPEGEDYANHYMAVNEDENKLMLMEPGEDTYNHYWTLTHVSGNEFKLVNPQTKRSILARSSVSAGGNNPIAVTEPEAEGATFAVEPYTPSDYQSCVALRCCADMTHTSTNPNGPLVYIQGPAGAYNGSTGTDTHCSYWFNTKDSNPTHASARKGAWVMAAYTGPTTAIAGIEADAAPSATGIYDLQGRRLSAPAPGLNIINGKKVFIK